MYYLFLDESGDLGKKSNFFVLSAIAINDPKQLNRIVKNMRRYKFRKELKKANEIKANKSNSKLIKDSLFRLNRIDDLRVYSVVLEKKKLRSDFLCNDKHKYYNFVAGKLAQNIILNGKDVEIRIDLSKGKQVLQKDFNDYFIKKLKENSTIGNVEIIHSNSHSWAGLQLADIVVWSLFQKLERGNQEFIDLIKDKQETFFVWE